MSDIEMHRPEFAHAHAKDSETILYKTLVTSLFVPSVLAVATGRLAGKGSTGSLWQEAREAAHASAGYAIKY